MKLSGQFYTTKKLQNQPKLKKCCIEYREYDTSKVLKREKAVYNVKHKGRRNNLEIRLSEKDLEVLMFLSRYKIIKVVDCKMIYKSKYYYRKRLKVLEDEKYIKRFKRIYIKLSENGIRLIGDFGYDYTSICRNKRYEDRILEISKVATLTLESDIKFIPSFEMKDNNIFTEISRKYLGKLTYKDKEFIPYYISKNKKQVYINQITNDIKKLYMNTRVIIFLENMDVLNNKFIFGKKNTIIINPKIQNFNRIRQLSKTDNYSIIKKIYPKDEILLSNWQKANYMTEDEEYIIFMPFIDMEKLYELNIYFNSKKTSNRINIITFAENKNKIEQILTRKVKITELDNYVGGTNENFK